MEQTDQSLEPAAGRYSGRVERLYAGRGRYGYILAASGERLAFRRGDLMGPRDPQPMDARGRGDGHVRQTPARARPVGGQGAARRFPTPAHGVV